MPVKSGFGKNIAALQNTYLMTELVARVVNRGYGVPGMACFYGFSGYGKTMSATFTVNTYDAVHIEVKSVWTKKHLCQQIADALTLQTQNQTVSDLVDAIGEELSASQRPLLIDEADKLTKKESMIEVIRDIYESSGTSIILIGEELLPSKLKHFERVHNRILSSVAAVPANEDDAKLLARVYCDEIDIEPPLLERIVKVTSGRARRIVVNLHAVKEFANLSGMKSVSLEAYKDQEISTGDAPRARRMQ